MNKGILENLVEKVIFDLDLYKKIKIEAEKEIEKIDLNEYIKKALPEQIEDAVECYFENEGFDLIQDKIYKIAKNIAEKIKID